MSMSTYGTPLGETELAQRWKERCQAGTFSQGVLGLGEVRVMGRSGDTPVQFPRIASLQALESLEPDEQWAVRTAQAIVEQAQRGRRRVVATTPPAGPDALPTPKSVTSFDPQAETLIVTSMITGG